METRNSAAADDGDAIHAVVHSPDEMAGRFQSMFPSFHEGFHRFNENDFVQQTTLENLQQKGLHDEYDKGERDVKPATVICEHTPQFKGCRFWIDPDSNKKRVVMSWTETMASYIERQGFIEYELLATDSESSVHRKRLPKATRQIPTQLMTWRFSFQKRYLALEKR